MALAEAHYEVTERLSELVDDSKDRCLATKAVKRSLALVMELH